MIEVTERAHLLYTGVNGYKTYGISVKDGNYKWSVNAYSLTKTDPSLSATFFNMSVEDYNKLVDEVVVAENEANRK